MSDIMERLRSTVLPHCLKPEEIDGEARVQAARVDELIRWFERYNEGYANPKWLTRHANELVFAVATLRAREAELVEASPDDLRWAGWVVAVHNDYRQDGEVHTFWLFTRGHLAIKGEGRTDAEALANVRLDRDALARVRTEKGETT